MKATLKQLFLPYNDQTNGSFNGYKILVLSQLALFLGLWMMKPITGIPSLPEILWAWNSLALTQGLLPELFVSIKTSLLALLLASTFSLILVYASTACFFRPTAFMASLLRFLGLLGLTYLFTLWTDSAMQLKLAILTFAIGVFMITGMLSEVQSVSREHIDYAKTLQLTGWKITWEIVVLGRVHTMLDLIRQNAAIGWTMLTMVEGMTRSEGGIGTLLLNQNRHFNLAAIFAIQLTILGFGLIQDWLLGVLRAYLCPYAELTTRR